jgi:alcohol-forming fatty acyl-CoA reductase
MLGIEEDVRAEMKETVTLVIHGAAKISFKAPIDRVVADNCLSSLELARMASEFEKLDSFVQVSSAYANTFLEDGRIEERIYPLGDPEAELSQIMSKHPPTYVAGFA